MKKARSYQGFMIIRKDAYVNLERSKNFLTKQINGQGNVKNYKKAVSKVYERMFHVKIAYSKLLVKP